MGWFAPVRKDLYYHIDLERFGIKDDLTEANATTQGFNAALKDAKEQGYHYFVFPEGKYLINTISNFGGLPEYGGGIRIPSNIHIIMDNPYFEAEANDRTGYSIFYLEAVENVKMSGIGTICGDRYNHDYVRDLKDDRTKTHEWGFGIHIRGCRRVEIKGLTVKNCTGDNIWIPAKGMMNFPGDYTPSRDILIQDCDLIQGRRNNLATNGCYGLTVERCDIKEAGGDTIGPQLGIDLEGYGDKGIKYDHPYEITIKNNWIKNNGRGALTAHTSGKVLIEGNFTDAVISYAYSTDVKIKDNFIINETGQEKPYGIDSIGVSSSETANRVNISGNTVSGFKTGICARGSKVKIHYNEVEGATAAAIQILQCEKVEVSDNTTDGNSVGLLIQQSKAVEASDNTFRGSENKYGIKIGQDSSDIILKDNRIRGFGGIFCESARNVVVRDHDIHLAGSGYGVYFDAKSSVFLDGVTIYNPENTPVYGLADEYAAIIKGLEVIGCKSIIGIYLHGGINHDIKGNTVRFRRGKDQGYGIYLNGAKGSVLARNDVISTDGFKLSAAYKTDESEQTTLIENIQQEVIGGILAVAPKDRIFGHIER